MVLFLSNDIQKHIILHILMYYNAAQYLLCLIYFCTDERGSGGRNCLTSRKHSSEEDDPKEYLNILFKKGVT